MTPSTPKLEKNELNPAQSCFCGSALGRNPFLCDACADKAWRKVDLVETKRGKKE